MLIADIPTLRSWLQSDDDELLSYLGVRFLQTPISPLLV
jgi:hypothetical protein